jgi:glycosyltransferase involved in cell wall biosynthesis
MTPIVDPLKRPVADPAKMSHRSTPESKTESPAVSVLLPVRDAAEYLASAIASLEAQTLADFEVLAVDDGSRDGSLGVLEAWAERDPRVRVVSQGRHGLVAALEHGRSLARAPFLARMDADDVCEPGRLERQLELMRRRPEITGCGCGVSYFPRGAVRGGALRYQSWLNALVEPDEIERDLFVECPLAHPTFFLRAAAVARVGGYRDLGWPEDYDLLLRLWEAGGRFAKVPDVLLRWREGPSRLSRVHPSYAPEAFRRLKVDVLRRTLLAGREGVVVWGAGPTGKAFAKALLARGVAVPAFVDLDPRKVGQRIHGAPVVGPRDAERYRRAFCVAAVGQDGAREEIRAALGALGWRETRDFTAVA